MKYFGTDGIRGVFGELITCPLAFKVGNALSKLKKNVKIVIGCDTRLSGEVLKNSFVNGLICGGGTVYDCEIVPTPAIAYLTKISNADFGIVISASHNPPEYNGIKIFDENGYKLSEQWEELVEKEMATAIYHADKIGKIKKCPKLKKEYINYAASCCFKSLKGLKVVLDCANGATSTTAKKVFEKCGATVFVVGNNFKRNLINDGCGCMHPSHLVSQVIKNGAHCGFAFDGDGDRVIACDEHGNLIDGDKMLFALSCYYAKMGFENFTAVGTILTNLGVEIALNKKGINLERTDVGDKYISEKLVSNSDCFLGGEQAGHIIIRHLCSSGDGVLVAAVMCAIAMEENRSLSQICGVKLFSQVSHDFITENKRLIVENENLNNLIEKLKETAGIPTRVVVRCSGTEPKVRIMVESENEANNAAIAARILNYVKFLNSSYKS